MDGGDDRGGGIGVEERGVVGPPRGSDPREILVDLDVGIPDNAVVEGSQEVEPDLTYDVEEEAKAGDAEEDYSDDAEDDDTEESVTDDEDRTS